MSETKTDCRAKDRASCPYHGNLLRSFPDYVKNQPFEPRVSFVKTVASDGVPVELDAMAITSDSGELIVNFANDGKGNRYSYDSSYAFEAGSIDSLAAQVDEKADEQRIYATRGSASERALHLEEAARLKGFSDRLREGDSEAYVKRLKKRAKAYDRIADSEVGKTWDLTPGLISKVVSYGDNVDKQFPDLSTEEKAIVLYNTLRSREKIGNDVKWGDPDYAEEIAITWSAYKISKRELDKAASK